MSHLITGIFTSRPSAEHAVDELARAGFSAGGVSLLMSDTTHGLEFGITTSTKAPEGAVTGAAGPIVAALTGLGAGAAAGGLTGALVGLGVPEHEARLYHDEIQRGRMLVGVYAHKDRKAQAKAILDVAGAEKVSS